LDVALSEVAPTAALDHLVRRYLRAFGPATPADFARWSGLGASATRPVRDHLGDELVTYRDEAGRMLLDLIDAPLPPEDQPAPVRLLPMWDTVLLGHDDRTRVLPDRFRRRVINHRGDVHETFLVDGVVAGVWQLSADEEERPTIVLEPFESLPAPAHGDLEAEAERLLTFLGDGRPLGEVVVRRPQS
jgi:Winged helix DNA-binding domain